MQHAPRAADGPDAPTSHVVETQTTTADTQSSGIRKDREARSFRQRRQLEEDSPVVQTEADRCTAPSLDTAAWSPIYIP